MNTLSYDFNAGLLRAPEPPCLSLYQPTHRHHPDNQQDPIRFGNLLKTLEQSLRQQYATRDIHPLLRPFQQLVDDRPFWNHTLDGLAVLATATQFKVYRLQRPVPELAVVADSFHIRPLIRILQSADRYQVLGLNRHQVELYEGNRDVLDRVELPPEVPQTLEDAIGELDGEQHVMVAPRSTGPDRAGQHFGLGSRAENIDTDTERFFRAVDRAILKYCSRPSGLPLLLAALPEHHTPFRRISHNPFLMDQALDVYPGDLSIDELRRRAWKVVEPRYIARSDGLMDMFNVGRPRGLSDGELHAVAFNAVAGRVGTLLIEAGKIFPGRLDLDTGQVHLEDLADPTVDDVLDDIAELVLKNSGQVIIVPPERMPTKTGVAALYRY